MNTEGRTPYLVVGKSLADKLESAIVCHIESSERLVSFGKLHNVEGIQRSEGRVIGVFPARGKTLSRKLWKKSGSKSGYWVPKDKPLQDELASFFVYAPDWLTRELAGDSMAFLCTGHAFKYITMARVENPTRFLLTVPSENKEWWKPDPRDAIKITWSKYFEMGEQSKKEDGE